MSPASLAARLTLVMPGLAARDLVLATPTPRPPPADAWVPRRFSVQIVLRGRIEVAVPEGDDLRWTTLTRRHLLAVCPGSWSPRSMRTARQHLAFGFGRWIEVAEYHTPVGGGGGAPVQRARIDPPPALAQLVSALQSCAQSTPRADVLHPLVLACLPLVLEALSRGSAEADRAAPIRAWLRDHCAEPLQRELVAAEFGIGGDHLSRLLRLAHGDGFVALVQRYRLERACDLLRSGDLPLAAIATDCGFGSPSYLIRLFRRRYGVTPDVWRQAWQGGSAAAAG